MDPLGILLEGLLKYFEPSFLAFALVVGYLWFFIFFFRTDQWNDLEWPERFFFGFLIGLFCMFSFSLVEFPIMILLIAFYLENLASQVFYWVPILFTLFLVLFRASEGKPLSSWKVKEDILRFMREHRSLWPFLLLIFSIVMYLGFGWANPFFNDASRAILGSLIFVIDFSLLLAFFVISATISQLSCLPFKTSREEALRMVFSFCFLSFLKREKRETLLREITVEEPPKKTLLQRCSSLLRNDLLHKAALVAALAFVILLADSSINFFSPTIQLVETDYEDNQIEVFRNFGGPVTYNIEVVKRYWVNLPRILVWNLNLSIPNPSNFSVYDYRDYIPWVERPYAIHVETDPSLSYSLMKDREGNIESINLMPISASQSANPSFIKLTYKDELDLNLIEVIEPHEENLGNGSILIETSLIMNNTKPERLHSSDFPLFSVEGYGNLTSFELFENGVRKTSPWKIINANWLWIAFTVNPNTHKNLTALAVFLEITN